MKILIIGNDPKEISGVANYTRPLASAFSQMGHTVYYLYSGAFSSRYDFNFKPYLRISQDDFFFESAEIVNSTCLAFNYGDPCRDISEFEMERVIAEYLDKIKPDVMHVHSRLGLPFSINGLAARRGITIINTIHVYGYLCQKRVMIDHKGEPCIGPKDLLKCSACTGSRNFNLELRRARIRSIKESVKAKCGKLTNLFRKFKIRAGVDWTPGYVKDESRMSECKADAVLACKLSERLRKAVESLNNNSTCVICVSHDVKNTLAKYGVDENLLMVQHIGSLIAEKQEVYSQPLHKPLVIGNIGGVNYYKGTHVLLDAIAKLKTKCFIVKIFGKYNEQYLDELMSGRSYLPVEFTGRYRPEELKVILKQIDIMVLPSICNDTAPQTIFESFSGGIPIIASNIGGFPDFVQNDRNGLLFEAGNSDDLARQMEYLLANPEQINKYKANIPKLKTIHDNAHELIAVYKATAKTHDRTEHL